jgi:hypothetical protein
MILPNHAYINMFENIHVDRPILPRWDILFSFSVFILFIEAQESRLLGTDISCMIGGSESALKRWINWWTLGALSDLKWWANVNFSGSQVICRLCYSGSTLAWLPWLSWLGYCSLLLLTLVSWQVWHELGELYIEAPPPRVLRWESSASPAMNTNPTWTSIYV